MSKIITQSEMVELIRDSVKGTTFVSIDISTDPRMNKGGTRGNARNPYVGKVRKLNTLTGMIGFDYQSSVNRLASKEDKEDRQAKSRSWGTLTSDRLFVKHDGGIHSIQMKVESSGDPRFIITETGETIAKPALEPWLPKKRKSSTQSDLEGEVVVRDVKIENVKSMRFKGETYTIVGAGKAIEYETISVPAQSVPTVPENIVLAVN